MYGKYLHARPRGMYIEFIYYFGLIVVSLETYGFDTNAKSFA